MPPFQDIELGKGGVIMGKKEIHLHCVFSDTENDLTALLEESFHIFLKVAMADSNEKISSLVLGEH